MATTYTVTANADALLNKTQTGKFLYLDAVLISRTITGDDTGQLPELQITGQFGHGTGEMLLPDLRIEISLDDKLWSGEILPEGMEGALNLPILQCEGRFGERGETGEILFGLQQLPGLTATGNFGPRMDDATLPDLRCSATGVGEEIVSLVRNNLPVLTCEARTGIRAASTLRLPTLSLSMSIDSDRWGTLNKRLTFPSISATISCDSWGGTLDRRLTFPTLTATGSDVPTGYVDAVIPPLKITATALSGAYGRLGVEDEYLPDLRITATATAEEFGSLSADLPTLTMQDVGTGVDGSAAADGTLTERSRFEDYILRFSRW
jgi:hypothetical protein